MIPLSEITCFRIPYLPFHTVVHNFLALNIYITSFFITLHCSLLFIITLQHICRAFIAYSYITHLLITLKKNPIHKRTSPTQTKQTELTQHMASRWGEITEKLSMKDNSEHQRCARWGYCKRESPLPHGKPDLDIRCHSNRDSNCITLKRKGGCKFQQDATINWKLSGQNSKLKARWRRRMQDHL